MSYEVLARKWRPQKFGDVVGQDHVVRTLSNAITSERIAHAYLFVGPRGTGKTSMARIFSKALNCEKGPTLEPCDACDACKEIIAGNSLDVLEIDGASNTGVEQVRELRESIAFAPARGRYKIYVIDEVHMLSVSAFNALLKTLEEPPKHVIFMFATTDPQKIPATVISRCQRFDLRRISVKDIQERLSLIAKEEKVDIAPEALLAIARGAEGGLRDATSALDQLISFRGKSITEEDVLSVFGLVAWSALEQLSTSMLKGDIPGIIRTIAELDAGGKDLQRLLLELIQYFRDLLVLQQAGEEIGRQDMTEAHLNTLKAQQNMAHPARVLRILNILIEADGKLRHALSKRTLLETSLIRCARAATVVSIDELLKQVNALKESIGGAGGVPEDPAPDPPPPHSVAAPDTPAPARQEPAAEPPVPSAGSDELALLNARWRDVVEAVGKLAPLAKNYLLDSKPVFVDAETVRIGFDPEFEENVEKINFPRNIKAMQRAIQQILKREVHPEFCVMDASSTLPGDTKFREEDEDGEETNEEPSPPRKGSKSRQEWMKDPAVRKTLEMFNGDIVDIRE